jgi:hypothetical protein
VTALPDTRPASDGWLEAWTDATEGATADEVEGAGAVADGWEGEQR